MAHDHHHHHEGDPSLADLLDLDAIVLPFYWEAAIDFVAEHAPDAVDNVLDLGAGSGMGTFYLARRLPSARVTAIDFDEEMLHLIRTRAESKGWTERVHTVLADLDDGWPELEPVDLAWASNSLHHLRDPDRTLTALFESVRPGGLVAVAEFSEPLRFLLAELGDGVEARLVGLSQAERAHELPHLGSDWSPWLTGAGFELAGERTFDINVTDPVAAGHSYAVLWLRRLRTRVADQLTESDKQLLADLLDGPNLRRTDVHIRGVRTITLARRP